MTPDTADTDRGLKERFNAYFSANALNGEPIEYSNMVASPLAAAVAMDFIEAELRALKERCKAAVPGEFVIPVSPLDPTYQLEIPRKIGHDACRTATLRAIDNVEI